MLWVTSHSEGSNNNNNNNNSNNNNNNNNNFICQIDLAPCKDGVLIGDSLNNNNTHKLLKKCTYV